MNQSDSNQEQNLTQRGRPRKRPCRPIQIIGECAIIPLTRGLFCLIDVADVSLVEGYNWYAHLTGSGRTYAARWGREGEDAVVYLHRVLGCPAIGQEVDHANGSTLDDRRGNLRACTRVQNSANTRKRNKTGMKGVWERNGSYRASIQLNGRSRHFGPFATPQEAARAYAEAAVEAFGEYAKHDCPELCAPHRPVA